MTTRARGRTSEIKTGIHFTRSPLTGQEEDRERTSQGTHLLDWSKVEE